MSSLGYVTRSATGVMDSSPTRLDIVVLLHLRTFPVERASFTCREHQMFYTTSQIWCVSLSSEGALKVPPNQREPSVPLLHNESSAGSVQVFGGGALGKFQS